MAVYAHEKLAEERAARANAHHLAMQLNDKVLAEDRDMTTDEETQWAGYQTEVEARRKKIERIEKIRDTEAELNAIPESRSAGHDDEGREGDEDRQEYVGEPNGSPEYEARFSDFLRTGETRDLTVATASEGGNIVASQRLVTGLIQALNANVFVRQHATVESVQGAQTLGVPNLSAEPEDGTWTTEIVAADEDSQMAFGLRTLTPKRLAKLLKVSKQLVRNAANVDGLVSSRLAYKMGITLETAYLTGSGSGQPLGVFTASASGVPTSQDLTTVSATLPTADEFIATKYKLRQAYWAKAKWCVGSINVAQYIAKLVDGDGRYIWRMSHREGEPDRLLGLPFIPSEYAPDTITTGLYVAALGDWSYYTIADDLNVSIQVVDQLYALTNQLGYIAEYNGDGAPMLGEAFVRMITA